MAKELRFAVVGLGMGKHHCKAVQDAKGAQLVAVCDRDRERLQPIAQQYGVKAYRTYKKLLEDPEVDAVCIATESGKHSKMGIEAAQAGKHLIVEKPVDVTLDAIRKLERAITKHGVKCGCIFQTRVANSSIMLKKAIDEGKLGQLIGVHGHLPWFRAQSYYEGPHGKWKGTWKWDGGGSLMNQGVHTLDFLLFLAGPVERAAGFYGVFNHNIQAEDQAVAALKFANGALGTLYTTTCCIPEGAQDIYFYGTKGSFRMQGGKLVACDMGDDKERERMMGLFSGKELGTDLAKDPMSVASDGHTVIIADLVEAVNNDREPAISIGEAYNSVAAAVAIYESARTGRTIKVKRHPSTR